MMESQKKPVTLESLFSESDSCLGCATANLPKDAESAAMIARAVVNGLFAIAFAIRNFTVDTPQDTIEDMK